VQLSIFVFLHKNGLAYALKVEGFIEHTSQFDKFLWGFNSAGSRILVVDVGPGKEAADNKLKVFLRDTLQLSQTWKVFVGGLSIFDLDLLHNASSAQVHLSFSISR